MAYRMTGQADALRISFRPRIGWMIVGTLGLLLCGLGAYGATRTALELNTVIVRDLVIYYLGALGSLMTLVYRERLHIDGGQVTVSRGYAGIMHRRQDALGGVGFTVPESPRFMSRTGTSGMWLVIGNLGVTSMVLSRPDACELAEKLNAWIDDHGAHA